MSRRAAVGAPVLAFGSGYDTPGGSKPVRTLQRLLARAGDSPGPIDGRYGPLTERAVKRFQSDHGLQVDGIAGPHTLAALSASTPTLYPGAGYGEHGGSGAVRVLQRLLARAGDSPGPIDGRYGPRTVHAVMRLQAQHRLKITGIAGPQTLAQLLGHGHARRSGLRPVGTRPHLAHPAGTRPHLAHPVGTRPRLAHPVGTRPRLAHGRPVARTTPVRHTNQPTDWPAATLLALIVGLGLLTLLTTARYTRRRRSGRFGAWPTTGSNGNHAAAQSTGGNGHHAIPVEREVTVGPDLRAEQDLISARPASSRAEDEGDPNVAFKHGVVLEEQGDLAGAEEAYRRADERGHPAAACNLGVIREGHGDLEGAKAAYGRADRRGDADGAFNLGALLEAQGDLEGAKAAYRRADQSGHAAAACNLGVVLEEEGDLAGAEEAYRRADQRGDAYGAFNLGAVLEAREDLAGCEAALHRAEQRGAAEVANMARSALADLGAAVAGPAGSNGGSPDAR